MGGFVQRAEIGKRQKTLERHCQRVTVAVKIVDHFKMLTFFWSLSIVVQIGLLILSVVGGIKLYLVLTMGVCKSTVRLTGKTIIITGANSGIGKEAAIDLAKRGARIILACRDLRKAATAKGTSQLIRNSLKHFSIVICTCR